MSDRGPGRLFMVAALSASVGFIAHYLWTSFLARRGSPGIAVPSEGPWDFPSPMDAGWAALIAEHNGETVGRGRVLVDREAYSNAAAASNTQTPIAEHTGMVAWRGMLDPLRPERGDYVPAGRYRMRFERKGQEMLVDLDRWEALPGGRGFARVRSADDELPSVLLEIGGH